MKVLAVDFGGSRIKAGLLEGSGVLAATTFDVPPAALLEQQLGRLKEHLLQLLESQALAMEDCDALAWALPCTVAPDHRTVLQTFGKWDDARSLNLGRWAAEEMGLPLVIENDARAALLGEWNYGAGRTCEHLVMVTLGTGIGTAVVLDGKPVYGRNGMAGNLGGHVVTHAGISGGECSCGVAGCLEAQVASWRLPGLARGPPGFSASPLSREAVISYREVFLHSDGKDPLAMELRDAAIEGWSILLRNSIRQFDPERIILGGGIMQAGEAILEPLRESLRRSAFPGPREVELVAAKLGDNAALAGCAWLASRGA